MPNWCSNSTEFYHSDPQKLREVATAYNEGTLFAYFKPLPNGEWFYDWCVANWGTKWDINTNGDEIDVEEFVNAGGGNLWYDTAWGPGNLALDAAVEQGFEVTNYYYEPGMGFAGVYQEGVDDQYDLSDMTWEEAQSELPEELNEIFNISEEMREYAEQEAEDGETESEEE